MTASDLPNQITSFDDMPLVLFFKKRGWTTEELHADSVQLVDVTLGSAVACGDGRLVRGSSVVDEHSYTHGPKFFGGIAGVAAL
jgi:hypothetical protein